MAAQPEVGRRSDERLGEPRAVGDALAVALARVAGERTAEVAGGAWDWHIEGLPPLSQPGILRLGYTECFLDPTVAHMLLTGELFELEAILAGRLVATGKVPAVFEALRLLPWVARAYCDVRGVDGIDEKPLKVLRILTEPCVSCDDETLGYGPPDQARLVALILAGVPQACRASQSGALAYAIANDRGLRESRLALVLEQYASLVGSHTRASRVQVTGPR